MNIWINTVIGHLKQYRIWTLCSEQALNGQWVDGARKMSFITLGQWQWSANEEWGERTSHDISCDECWGNYVAIFSLLFIMSTNQIHVLCTNLRPSKPPITLQELILNHLCRIKIDKIAILIHVWFTVLYSISYTSFKMNGQWLNMPFCSSENKILNCNLASYGCAQWLLWATKA